jgi:hypothetical protein
MRLAFLSLLAACGSPTIIDGKSYANACTASADCVAVFFGTQCEPCACPNAAISTSARVTYEADRSSALATCGSRKEIACGPCEDRQLACVELASPVTRTGQFFCQLK